MGNDDQNEKVERAVKLLEMREGDNDLTRTVALEIKIRLLDNSVRALAERRLAYRRQAAVPAAPMPAKPASREEQVRANIEALTRAKEEKSRAQRTFEGAIRHAPEAIEALNDAADLGGAFEGVAAATDVVAPGAGIAIGQAPKLAAAPFKINDAIEVEKQRNEIETIASAAESRPRRGGEVVGRADVIAEAAVRRQKGNPDALRWRSGGGVNVSEITGQHQTWSDDEAAHAPATEPENTSSAAAGNARAIAAELQKKRNKKLVDAGTALVPKSAEFLEFRRLVRDNGWATIRNKQNRSDLAMETLHLACVKDDPDSREVLEVLIPDEKERDELEKLYSSPITSGTAITRLAKKLEGRRG
jgi:hypothetical protein